MRYIYTFKKIIILFIFFSTYLLSYSEKPKDYDFSKEIYFNPKIPFSALGDDIDRAGYRLQKSDTNSVGSIQNSYKIYRKVFGNYPDLFYIDTIKDTIFRITIYFKMEDASKIKIFQKLIEKFISKHIIDKEVSYDAQLCGDDYQTKFGLIFRHETLDIYFPIDVSDYYKIEFFPNNDMGLAFENFNKALEDLLKAK